MAETGFFVNNCWKVKSYILFFLWLRSLWQSICSLSLFSNLYHITYSEALIPHQLLSAFYQLKQTGIGFMKKPETNFLLTLQMLSCVHFSVIWDEDSRPLESKKQAVLLNYWCWWFTNLSGSAQNWKLPSVILYVWLLLIQACEIGMFLWLQIESSRKNFLRCQRNKLPIIPSINLAYFLMPPFRVGLKTLN